MSDESESRRLDELLAQASWLDRLARRLVRDPSEADDVVQETWVAALRDKSRAHSVRGWLAQIARNVVLQRGRGESARRQREHSVARAEASEAETEAFERAQSQKRLVDAVLALDEPYRSTVILHYFDHLDVAEVARKLGVSESTVRTRLSRALAELRARFQRQGGPNWALAFLPLAAPKSALVAPPLIVGGMLVTATWKIAAGVALVATLAWLSWPAPKGLDTPSSALQAGTQPAQPFEAPELEQQSGATVRSPLDATPVPKAVVSSSDRATLDLHVRWGDDGTNASDIGIELWLAGAEDPFNDRREARTDAQGRAHFEDLAPGDANIKTDRSDGEGCTLSAGEHATIDLTIPDGFDLHGQVVDADDRPVAGARIWLSHYFNYNEGRDVATSDGGGTFLIRDVGPARYVGARHARYGPSALELLQAANVGQRVDTKLVLGRELAELAGSVRDAAGRAVSGASVRIGLSPTFERGEDGITRQRMVAPQCVRTGGNGRFLAQGLGTSWTNIVVRAEGFAPAKQESKLEPGTNELEFTLATMATLHGRVVDAQGAPVKRAFLGWVEYGGPASAQTWTREDGSYRLVGLPAGSLEIHVSADAKGELKHNVSLHPGDDLEWQVQLIARPGVFGRVLDVEGKPAVGFMVGAIEPERPGGFMRNTKTDAEGRFQLDDWPAEASAIEVREDGAWVGMPAALVEQVKPGSGEEILIRLAADALRSAYFTGRVLDENGKIVEAAEVSCFVEASGMGTSVATDAQGRFRYGPVRPGRYYLSVNVKGYAECTRRNLALTPGETRDVGDIRLERPGEIRVRLRLPAGFDAEQATGYIAVTGSDGTAIQSIEIRAGTGKLGGLAPGHYGLRFTSDRLRAAPTEVDVQSRESREIELSASPGTSRMVSVRVPAEAHGTRVHLVVLDGAGAIAYEEQSPVRPGPAMYFSVPGLVVGTYRVELSTAEGLRASGTIEVKVLEPVDSVLELAF